jgi:hypothetical protein
MDLFNEYTMYFLQVFFFVSTKPIFYQYNLFKWTHENALLSLFGLTTVLMITDFTPNLFETLKYTFVIRRFQMILKCAKQIMLKPISL